MNQLIMVCHSQNNNTHTGLVISLFKHKSFDQSGPHESPQILDIRELKQTDAAARLDNP